MAKGGGALSSWLSGTASSAVERPPGDSGDAAAVDSPLEISLEQLRRGGNATIMRISPEKRSLVEDIDTEEDDAEFDERAHWGRRRGSKKARKSAAARDDKSQPSIALFCIPKPGSAAAAEAASADADQGVQDQGVSVTESASSGKELEIGADEPKKAGEESSVDSDRAASEAESVEKQEVSSISSVDDAGREPEPSSAPSSSPRKPNRHDSLSKSKSSRTRASDLSEDSVVTTPDAKQPTPTISGRPKRQAALKAEQLKQQGLSLAQAQSDEVVFLTPPPRTRRQRKQVKSDNHGTESPIVIGDTPGGSEDQPRGGKSKRGIEASPGFVILESKSVGHSTGRKRKLDMDKKKSGTTPSPSKGSKVGATKAAQSFFLTEQEKKQLQEIEAVSSFREELKIAREKDLAFFTGTTSANPFFKPVALAKQRSTGDGSADEGNVSATDRDDDESLYLQGKVSKKWSKHAPRFPSIQHVCSTMVSAEDNVVCVVPRRVPNHDDVTLDDEGGDNQADQEQPTGLGSIGIMGSTNMQVDEEGALSDMYWFRGYPGEEGELDDDQARWISRINGTEDDFITELVERYHIREKRVRELLEGLETAKKKRLSKEQNLSFVDRYLPVSASGIVGNKETLRLLLSWLTAWKSGNNSRGCFQSELYAFEDDDSEDETCALHRLFILEGESGAGKSAAVYGCAEELGFEIIEINAAQNRSGRSIVEIAGEATQSTRVLHVGGRGEKGSKKKTPPKKKAKTSKRKSLDSSPSQSSLVLFEDVDLVFDEDKGFLSSLCSIAKHSKCPIIVTCRELPENFPTKPARLNGTVVRPSLAEFSAWIMLVAHVEGVALSPALVDTMGRFFKCDIRHSLHFLQSHLPQLMTAQSLDACWQWRGDAPTACLATVLDGYFELHGRQMNDDEVVDLSAEDQQEVAVESKSPPPDQCNMHAWTMWGDRSFDMMLSNLLPELSAAAAVGNHPEDDKTHEEKQADAALLSDLADVMDAASLGDMWIAQCNQESARRPSLSFFEQEHVKTRTRDLRRAGLDALMAPGRPGTVLLETRPTLAAECVRRTRNDAITDLARDAKCDTLGDMIPKIELPLVSLGTSGTEARFMLDYMPAISRIVNSNPGHQEGRRRTSRRNHYLRDVLADMTVVDDLALFTSYVQQDEDQIVGASPLTSPSK